MNDQQEPGNRTGDLEPPEEKELSASRNGRFRLLWDWVIQVVIYPLNIMEALIGGIVAKIRGGRRGG